MARKQMVSLDKRHQAVKGIRCGRRLTQTHEITDHDVGDARAQVAAAGTDRADRVHHFLAGRLLQT